MFVEASNLFKSYVKKDTEAVHVLQDVSISLERGSFTAIVGSSGSGKSTLLHLLGGLDKPDSGSIFVSGKQIVTLADQERSEFRNSTIGFVFQFHHLLPEFTALENVCMPAMIKGRSESSYKKEALELLDTLGVGHRKHHRPSELSGGEQQRVAIARALINRPPLLLADEPTGNLDRENSERFLSLLHSIHQDFDLTILLVTHDSFIASAAHHTLHLTSGKIEPSEN